MLKLVVMVVMRIRMLRCHQHIAIDLSMICTCNKICLYLLRMKAICVCFPRSHGEEEASGSASLFYRLPALFGCRLTIHSVAYQPAFSLSYEIFVFEKHRNLKE